MTHTLDRIMPKDYTLKEAAALLDIEARSLQYYVNRGRIKAILEQRPEDGYPAPTYFIDEEELFRFKDERLKKLQAQTEGEAGRFKILFGDDVEALIQQIRDSSRFIFTNNTNSQVIETALIALHRHLVSGEELAADRIEVYKDAYLRIRKDATESSFKPSPQAEQAMVFIGDYLKRFPALDDVLIRSIRKGKQEWLNRRLIVLIALLFWAEHEA